MNCQDITSILDDRDISALIDVEHEEAKAHLHGCADCAREWALQLRLCAVAIPAMPSTLAKQCRALIAARSHLGADTLGRRRTSRLILIGTLAAVAAAAALLNATLRNSHEEPAIAAASVSPSPPEPERAIWATPAAAGPAAPKQPAVEPKKKTELPESPRFTVRVLPLQDRTSSESSRQAVKAIHAALLDGLRQVPGLTLLESEVAPDPAVPGEFLLTVKGDGPVQGKWAIDIMLMTDVPITGDAKGGHARVPYRFSFSNSAPPCAGPAIDLPAGNCFNPQSNAMGVIDAMRQMAFPLDPNARLALQAQLLDRTLDASRRWKAFESLRTERAVVRAGAQSAMISRAAPPIDAETLRGALDLATTTDSPFMRSRIWRALRGIRQPALVQPLIDAARLEGNDSARLAAVTTLAADYAEDEQGRAALESIAINDSRELVRMIAQRGVSGEASWNQYAVARLQDSKLPDGQRVEPLAYMASSGESRQLRGLLDASTVEALAQVMPRALAALPDPSVPRSGGNESLFNLASVLAETNQPATIDLLLGMLKVNGDPAIRRMAVLGLSRHRDDARARAMLDEIAASDPDVKLREQALSAQPQLVTPPPGTH